MDGSIHTLKAITCWRQVTNGRIPSRCNSLNEWAETTCNFMHNFYSLSPIVLSFSSASGCITMSCYLAADISCFTFINDSSVARKTLEKGSITSSQLQEVHCACDNGTRPGLKDGKACHTPDEWFVHWIVISQFLFGSQEPKLLLLYLW